MTRGFGHESSANTVPVEWYTPPHIFTALNMTFDLDPCAAPTHDHVPANTKYVLPVDGLEQDWHGTVWLNPPYGKQTAVWLDKLIKHNDGIALVFARTDTKWFQEAMQTARVVCFVSQRVKFINGTTGESDGTPGAGSALIGWGQKAYDAIINSNLGICMVLAGNNC